MERKFVSRFAGLSIFLVLSLVFAGLCLGQDMTKGAISGTVFDSSSAVVPGAQVTVLGTIDKRSATSDAYGRFEIGNLLPGTYSVKAELSGFKTVTFNNIVVNVGRTAALKMTMQVGEVSDLITVDAGADAVDLSSTALSSNLNDKLIDNLPLQRAVTSLFYLATGVTDGLDTGESESLGLRRFGAGQSLHC